LTQPVIGDRQAVSVLTSAALIMMAVFSIFAPLHLL